MLEVCVSTNERWKEVSQLLGHWLTERKELLISYCALAGTDTQGDDYEEEEANPLNNQLKRLCQILVDYVSAGHFEIYEQLQRESEEFNDADALQDMAHVFQEIQQNTELCLAFNDSCEHIKSVRVLTDSVSLLGETLAERFELEDILIERMHNRYGKIKGEST